MTAGTPAIRATGLTKVYRTKKGEFRAVDGISFAAHRGEVLGFLGPNGAGKTTTIKMICGLIEPTAGQVELNGFDIARQRRQAVAQFGAVLEGARNVYWTLTARQNLRYFAALKHAPRQGLDDRIDTLLRELELYDVQHKLVGAFSRGMQQKVAIAAALVSDPTVVLLDEPTLGLDVAAARTVRQQIADLRARGKTVLLTTHQMDLAQELCDRIAIVQQGQIRALERTADLVRVFGQKRSRIVLRGRVPGALATELTLMGASVVAEGEQVTVEGIVPEEQALEWTRTVLTQALGAGLYVESVTEARSSLEDVFLSLTGVKRHA